MLRYSLVALVCTLALASTAGAAPDQDEIDSKTNAEILAMGKAGWAKYCDPQDQDSFLEMIDYFDTYAAAARERNDRLRPRRQVRELRAALDEFAEESGRFTQMMVHGGGASWGVGIADKRCDVEEVIYALLGGPVLRAAPAATGPVNRQLAQIKQLSAQKRGIEDDELFPEDAEDELASVESAWVKIKRLAAGLDRAGSDRVLVFCQACLKEALDNINAYDEPADGSPDER